MPPAEDDRSVVGRQFGSHHVLGLLGSGGMGEVYRAHDSQLGRDVAIKILPAALTSDPERRARFDREARLLASLNHPHIGAIYGVEESDGQRALVLELIEGETLAERLARGPIEIKETLELARQVTTALEAAHEKGVVHRDLKPANIKITPEGVVKVLDFGLAKAAGVVSEADSTPPPTVTFEGTRDGMLLGTVAYMSPEQARGKPVDKRTDIWAFGCVLYEMLIGRAPFSRDTITDTLATILERDPSWAALPATTPATIQRLLTRCLEKDPRRRLHDIADARIEIEDAIGGGSQTSRPAAVQSENSGRLPWAIAAVATLAALTALGAVMWRGRTPPQATPLHVSRTTLTAPGAAAIDVNAQPALAITPDGARIAYVGEGSQIFVRPLARLEPSAIFTAATPLNAICISPDGEWIAFFEGNQLRKMALTGGPAETIAVGVASAGATWAPDDTIVMANTQLGVGLQRVSAAGGIVTDLTRPAKDRGELHHVYPEMLPGGRAVLFTITAITGGTDASRVAVLDLSTNTYKVVVPGGSHAHYARTGHLIYAAGGALHAVPFDLAQLERRGSPVTVVDSLVTSPEGGAEFAVSDDGTLVYAVGQRPAASANTLVWVDRQGTEEPLGAPPRAYSQPRLSPDGTEVAAAIAETGVWVWNLRHGTLNKLSFEPAGGFSPVWAPNGHRVLFSTAGPEVFGIFAQVPDVGGAADKLVTATSGGMLMSDVTRDGTRAIFSLAGRDVMALALDGTRRIEPLVQTPHNERNGIVSPDGRWLAYESDSSSRFEIYVRPFPNVQSGQRLISSDGGTRPLWMPGGKELTYVAPNGALMAVAVNADGGTVGPGHPRKVVEGPYATLTRASGRTYDVSLDGQRFLMVRPPANRPRPQIVVVQNWFDELRRLVPSK